MTRPKTGSGITTAMILAAGLGTRIRDVSNTLPKQLLSIAGQPLIDYALSSATQAGVTAIIVNTHYRAELIAAHLKGCATKPGAPFIRTVHEGVRLETGGGVRNALPHLGPQAFFVMNSDSIVVDGSGNSLLRLAAAWDEEQMDALLLLSPLATASGYDGAGDFVGTTPDDSPPGTASALRRRAEGEAGLVFTGVQVLHPRLFSTAPDGAYSLNIHYDQAAARGRLYGLSHVGDWFHVGTADGLRRADAGLSKAAMR